MDFYSTNIIAKRKDNNFQTLEEHTLLVVKEAIEIIQEEKIIKKISTLCSFPEDKIKDLIFFSAYFHDIGKATKEFQESIKNNTHQSYHSLYSASVLVDICDFEFLEGDVYINLLLLVVLSHHTLFPYKKRDVDWTYLPQAKEFFYKYKDVYKNIFQKECEYNFEFEVDKDIGIELKAIEDDLKYIHSKEKLKILYCYLLGVLNIADWRASAKFENKDIKVSFEQLPKKDIFDFKLKEFQEKAFNTNSSVLIEIPTGEGKTEASLLWAINNLQNRYSKIIYTLPTQTTSNKLFDRVVEYFSKDNCGLIHSSAKSILEAKFQEDYNEFSDYFLNKTFTKPITVSTIDSLLKHFLNIGRFNLVIKNFINSVVIIDEVHSYDFKMLGFIKRFLEICKSYNIKVCIMSASIPNRIKSLLNIDTLETITQKELFSKKANKIIKQEKFLEDDYSFIQNKIDNHKNILIIRNRVESAIETYEEIAKKYDNVILYHSEFKKKDKIEKEKLIFEKLRKKEKFILIATQIVEVSLDIDFDILFTEIAPIDSLIQRFGRVNRKKNPDKICKCYIYKVKTIKPYNDYMLDMTYKTIKNGVFEIGEYVKWLNIVYDELFENDIGIKNKILGVFNEGYRKYDKNLSSLNGIEKSVDNYEFRENEYKKQDYLLYDDYMEGRIGFEYTISLPVWVEKEHLCENINKEKGVYYKVLNLEYSFKKGVIKKNEKTFEFL
jgi:CRISPR-associated endonuclease/helicase Cas3